MNTPKEIRAEKERLLSEIKDISDNRPTHYGSDVRTLSRFAELLSHISDEQAHSAAKLERQTQQLIRLTWALVWLTIALLVFAIFVEVRH